MYLKEIVASGFKSFADKLDIKLDGKTTCIVGPNGSGKSNILDAVRWVLGEQSVKSLRGDGAMSDVIFSGSKSRKPLNVASVELVFDNSDHYLKLDYEEISIKRKVYRSGENEYFLNNQKCRLKDIVDLLMDSGVGKESFNIISQGEVQKILSNSPSDRRVIFEEAAGILKYKKRKEESLRKLDRTHHNLDRVNDIIKELEIQVEPLREQSEKAKEYLENKKGLEKYEVALLAFDIDNILNEVERVKAEKERLEQEVISLQTDTSSVDSKSMEDKSTLQQLEQELTLKNAKLLKVVEEVEKLNSERQLLKERSKSNKNKEELQEKIRLLLEEKGQVESSILLKREEMRKNGNEVVKCKDSVSFLEEKLDKLKKKQTIFNQDFFKISRDNTVLEQKNKVLQTEIDSSGGLPNSVRSLLRATSLDGIYDTIGNILNTNQEYTKALEVAISASRNFVIVKDEKSSIDAIHYLKEKRLGRATFFPLNVIKGRFIDEDTLYKIEHDEDYIAVLSTLVEYDKKYQNIVENQLGTTLVSPDIASATRLSKKISHRYKIVTLTGDVVHIGGSMSGGSSYQASSMISLKQQVTRNLEQIEANKKELNTIDESLKEITGEIERIEKSYFDTSKNSLLLEEQQERIEGEIKNLEDRHERISSEWESYQSLNDNVLSEKEEELITKFHERQAEKELLSTSILNMNKSILDLKMKLEEDDATLRVKNSRLREKEKEVREKEVLLNRNDVKLDQMLLTLNEEYSLTFERALSEYHLDIEEADAREKVNLYKKNIKEIGMVNILSIEEYERVSTRYEFLIKQREDLENAESVLLNIMNEMDAVMKEEFLHTFQEIEREFKGVFKELFKGGDASLRLTCPDDLLTTGIEIVASPPGKKLTTISLLSGGEKTLTAISLLFAILNVRTVPFCVFDEVEAALDEANVSEFGKYLDHYKNKTQFLIITHKKKTMEYADTLYGITMQESGVSKLVSVKLHDHIDII